MKIVVPQDVNSSNLTSTTVVNDVADWAAGTYEAEDQAVYGEYIYEALTTTTDQPDVGAAKETPTWVQLGRSNKWRMFRDGTDSVSSQLGGIDVEIDVTSTISSVAILGASGTTVTVTLTNSIEGEVYSEQKSLVDIGAEDWWEYFFLDYEEGTDLLFAGIPAYTGDLSVTIDSVSGSDSAECGRLIMGLEYEVGITVEDVQSRLQDFSRKERDAFGNLTLVPRRTIRIVDYQFMTEPEFVDSVQRRFRNLAATPALYIGDDDIPETIVFGVFYNFSTIINGHTITECSAAIEEF